MRQIVISPDLIVFSTEECSFFGGLRIVAFGAELDESSQTLAKLEVA